MTSQDRLDEFVDMLPAAIEADENAFDSAIRTMELFNEAAGDIAAMRRSARELCRALFPRRWLYLDLRDAGYPRWLASFIADYWPERWLVWALERMEDEKCKDA